METASTDHVTGTAVGAVVGGVVTGVALAVAAPILAPVAAVAATIGLPLTVIGMGVGGWWGYNRAENKALKLGWHK